MKYDICVTEELKSAVVKKYTCTFNALSMEWFKLTGSPEAIGIRIRKMSDIDNLDINHIAGFFIERIKEIEFHILNNK